MKEEKSEHKKKHKHDPYPDMNQIFICNNYPFALVKIRCVKEGCEWFDWDIAEVVE
jgi:hypothetical protein